jgi:replicative DNA helicase
MPVQKVEEQNFGFLGTDFQIALIKELIEDKRFSNNIIDVMENKYFDGPYFKYIVQNIKELHQRYLTSPSYITIEQKIKIENDNDNTAFQIFIDTLNNIKKYDYKNQNNLNREFVHDTAINFCKQQVLRRELKVIEKIIDNGKFEDYNKIEGILQKAMQIGIVNDADHDVFEDIRGALQKDARTPIPTGIEGLDLEFKGGLALGELGVVLAPTGIGKSTILSYFANSAFNNGFNVLQLFFEDNERDIMLKHFTKWTGLSPDEQMYPENIENVIETCENIRHNSSNFLTLSKYPSQTLRVSELKTKLRKLKAEGKDIQLLLIDYLECLLPDKSDFDDEWKGEGSIMRSLESMTKEFNIAIWVATQGGRCVSLDTIIDVKGKGKIEIKYANVGDEILTHLGYRKISQIFPIQKKPVYKITLKSGKNIKVSENHLFPLSSKNFKSINTGLSIGNKLLTKKKIVKREFNIKDFYLDEIINIELIGEEDTIDISVEDTFLFFANDIYTHNSAMSSELVTADQTGGSIKKMQVGHVILTIGKTLDQKSNKTATMSIAKSRIGNDGLVYRNCPFDNEYMKIEAVDNETLLGFKEENEQRRAARPHELYKEMQKKIQNHESKLINMEMLDPSVKPPLIDDVLKLLPEIQNNNETNNELQNNFGSEILEIKEENQLKKNRAAELYKFNTGQTKNSDEPSKDRVKELLRKKSLLGV